MSVDNLLDHSTEAHRIETFYNALNSIGDSLDGESWFDDLYETYQGYEYEIHIDERWLDEPDEAA